MTAVTRIRFREDAAALYAARNPTAVREFKPVNFDFLRSSAHFLCRKSVQGLFASAKQSCANVNQRARSSGCFDCSAMMRQAAWRRRYSSQTISLPSDMRSPEKSGAIFGPKTMLVLTSRQSNRLTQAHDAAPAQSERPPTKASSLMRKQIRRA